MWKYILPLCLAVGLAAPADAKKSRRPRKSTRPPASHKAAPKGEAKGEPKVAIDRADVPPKSNQATEYEKAQKEIDELKSSREIPVVSLDNQSSDGENPLKKR